MFKRKKLLLTVLIITIITSISGIAFAATPLSEIPIPSFDQVSPFVDSNRYSHQKSTEVAVNQQEINPNYQEINTTLGTIYVDPVSLAFQFYNNNGYIWSSTIDYQSEDFPVSVTYSLRSALNIASYNTNNNSFAILREHLFTMGTSVDLEVIDDGFMAAIQFGTSRIKMNLYVTFNEDGITVEIPDDEIEEPAGYRLNAIQVYRDFGAVKEDNVPGYVFIPDGIGALINYKTADINIPDYKKYIYGNSLGYNTETNLNNRIIDGQRIYAPVFGFVHGIDQQAVFAHITSGALYGNINVSYPSRNRGYTSVYSEFIYRTTYAQPVDRSGSVIILLQDFRNPVNIKINYTLLEDDDANYVGMAKAYRNQLLDQSRLVENIHNETNIPLHVSTIGLERKDGILFTENVLMTTLDQFRDMIKTLNDQGITNIVASIDGYTSKGASWSAPIYTGLSRKVGSKSDLEDIHENVSDLYLIAEFMKASSRSSGYNRYLDLAKKINNQLYRYDNSTDTSYLLEHSKVRALYRDTQHELNNLSYSGLAIKSFGSLLYDDFSHDKYLNDLIHVFDTLLADQENKTALFDANDYMFTYMDTYFDFPMYSSQFLIFDDTVPFLPIALSNTMQLFGPYANFYPYARDELLRHIDFNIYPSFVVTHKSSKYLQNTGLSDIYSSRFSDLDHVINTYYHFVNDALKYTIGANIISRDILALGVVSVGYSNGIDLIINYTDQTYTYLGHEIGPKDYYVGGLS
ncbi:MAG: DUF5696 domain-containing protein [Acholeplasmataceae bacterium]|nr:DUF5696 domain-containing protein [Acholeplasmataceae bacterium]